ncbi:flavin reductase family protein [Allorhizobium sp. BGMRC 0089]|uniref:flavin reductase family protein n=1 Tax=Allorhizobium sonneratiae TaxID=2934936 RepID=UPI0020339A4A|nr:flavin reductase family protein [Allorhizobium sonneratiae]MCM2293971.1 flavin reductase family protein [Allorhizobium sonneratiae]
MSIFDPRALRDAFGAFATGVTVVTAIGPDGRPLGFTANSFSSVSLDPPLLSICLAKSSRNFATMTTASGFAVNILADDQKEVSSTFARPVEDRFATVTWQTGPHGSPVVAGVAAWFDCSLAQVIEAGDHVILLGRVEAFGTSGKNGLGYVRGGYFTPALTAKAVSAAVDGHLFLSAVVERQGDVLLLGETSLSLPGLASESGDPQAELQAHLQALTGLTITIGTLYSVYEEKQADRQHIVYRAFAGEGVPGQGRFVPVSTLPSLSFATMATGDIMARFARESAFGNFGVYFGDDTAGRVHAMSQAMVRKA